MRLNQFHVCPPNLLSDETKAFNEDGKGVGSVNFSIKYDKAQLYEGEKIGVFDKLPQK